MKPLSKKSWHSTLYRLTYGYYGDLPSNLCPYFWQLLFALVLTATVGLFLLPYYLVDKLLFGNDSYKWGYFSNANIGSALGSYILCFLVFMMIFIFFLPWNEKTRDIWIFGLIEWTVVLSIAGYFLWKKWFPEKIKTHYVESKKKEPSILVEFIKAKYNKYCPKITWRD